MAPAMLAVSSPTHFIHLHRQVLRWQSAPATRTNRRWERATSTRSRPAVRRLLGNRTRRSVQSRACLRKWEVAREESMQAVLHALYGSL